MCLWLRYESVVQWVGGGGGDRQRRRGGLGALAFCFNDCRSLLPLLPVIAF